jgi:hypothetical protein
MTMTLYDSTPESFDNDTEKPMSMAFIEDHKERFAAELRNRLGDPSKWDPEDIEELEEDFERALNAELGFCAKVLDAFDRWSEENDVVALWDVDETIGKNRMISDAAGNLDYDWSFRVSFEPLMEVLRHQYPDIQHGILSDRTKLAEQMQSADHLGPMADYFSSEHLYSSRDFDVPDEVEDYFVEAGIYPSKAHKLKLAVIRDLQNKGLNVKVIDDNAVAKTMGPDGVHVYQEQARL